MLCRNNSSQLNVMGHYNLLIIGAGASGVAAAVRLLEKGFSNFKIIEAESRIGGRINSLSLGNIPLELGAEWIHGESGNPVYELATKYNLTDNTAKYFFNQTNFFEFSGNQINKAISQGFTLLFDDIMGIEEKDDMALFSNASLGEYFDIKFQNAVKALKTEYNVTDELCEKFRRLFENWENSIDGSHSWYETSLKGHLEYWEYPGNLITRWKNNCYQTLFDLLLKKNLGSSEKYSLDDKIYFNKEVSEIKWNEKCIFNEPNVEVKCSDGTIFSADHVLFTCSLGVLKERSSNMFSPPLPAKKLLCIQNLGFGTVDKIFLKFSHRWWKNDLDGFAFLWSEEEKQKCQSDWLSGVICFHPIDSNFAMLRGWITGEAAQFMETLSNDEIIQGLTYLFQKFLGSKYSIPPIEICLTSKWFTNSHFRGSYSCRLMQSERSDVWASDLAEPIYNIKGLPLLLFGGEATSNHYFSTVHGALEAGWREAERLWPFVRKSSQSNKKEYQIIIVGAGISGLAAAKTFYENGVTDFIVLEAQSKPGGRILSVQIDDYHLELGAQWIHGEKNEVFRLCKANGLLTEDFSSEGEGLYLRENGEIIDESIIKEVDDVIKNILEDCENFISSAGQANGPHSIGQELSTKFNQYLENCIHDSESVKKVKKDLLDWHNRFQLIDNSCSDLSNLSAKAWGLFKFCGGNDYVNFKNGYESFIDILVKGLPEGVILCDTAVEKIDWTETQRKNTNDSVKNSNVKIICKNGSKFISRHVIITCSLGYLKCNHKSMFSPPLPKYLTEAVDTLDFGVLNKIFLIYEEPWWGPDVKGFQLVWSHDNTSESEENWGRYVTGFDVIKREKPVLLGWVGGKGAIIVEKLPEKKIGIDATMLLRKFYRKSLVPFPKMVLRSSWWSNEYIRGGYSHITVKCDDLKINNSNLARPVFSTDETSCSQPIILLAGESTHKNYFSTVHGAYESGQSQAQVVIDYLHSHESSLRKSLTKLNLSNGSAEADY